MYMNKICTTFSCRISRHHHTILMIVNIPYIINTGFRHFVLRTQKRHAYYFPVHWLCHTNSCYVQGDVKRPALKILRFFFTYEENVYIFFLGFQSMVIGVVREVIFHNQMFFKWYHHASQIV
ncbi:unnamed protein product [Acanthoscelides obtectus]|uniref:Uncharacterized protein n=1 Tax=Acanthoscelides obtectus TaxID=200917 RepID=A0A9P0MAG3_ACAOB|nr:unnamed protein product [Acanthoscelides obtectus]CAK1639198.1 hypothetical protein AOBTE_LOCUS11042 [Acanthoscelides obtectus]